MPRITINGITIDPTAQSHALAAANLIAPDASGSDYILIQTRQPIDAVQRQALKDLGVEVLEYVPESTYVCHYKPADLSKIRALPFVEWVNIYMKGFKLAPALLTSAGDLKTANLVNVHNTPPQILSRQPRLVDVVLQSNADPALVREKVAAAAHLTAESLQVGVHKIRLSVPQRYLRDLAAIDEVRHIEDVVPLKLHNTMARQVLKVETKQGGPPAFEGEGQVIAVADTGFDNGSMTDVHPAFAGRVLKLYALGREGDASDPDGHGTHVAGSVLGDGQSTSLDTRIAGTAPKAKLVFQSVLDSSGDLSGLPNDLNNLFLPPYRDDGARVHSNSWGARVGDGSYDANAHEIDNFVWNHRDLVVCFAAGNAGKDSSGTGRVDPGSVGAPSTAKNCITVGASENNRPDFPAPAALLPAKFLTYGVGWSADFPADPIATDRVADNIEGMAAFSGRGPTTDHRIKPDIVAPGTAILSALSRAVTTPGGWGSSQDALYFFEGGTSMATPLVAGCAALVREFLIKHPATPVKNPSAALVKALLINGAQPIAGQYTPSEAGDIPSINQGFGRVDFQATVGPYSAGTTVSFQDEKTELDTNQEERTSVKVPAGARQLKATLVWTDPAGESLQNDLDLIVQAQGGQERHGNVPDASSDFDRANNVEQIIWNSPPSGDAVVIVRAFRVTRLPQSYALVVRIS